MQCRPGACWQPGVEDADLVLEAGYFRTRQSYALLRAIDQRQQGLVDIVRSEDNPIQFFVGQLVWSLAYGKVRWLGGAISRFDFNIALGGGAMRSTLPPMRRGECFALEWTTTDDRLLPTAHCPLPTAHCPLPTAHCP